MITNLQFIETMDLRLTLDVNQPIDQCVTVAAATERGQHVIAAFALPSPCSWEDSIRIKAVAQLTGFKVLQD